MITPKVFFYICFWYASVVGSMLSMLLAKDGTQEKTVMRWTAIGGAVVIALIYMNQDLNVNISSRRSERCSWYDPTC